MANKIQKYVSWENHILIMCPCAGGNTVFESITPPHQDLSCSLISAFLGFVFFGNLETAAAIMVLKLLLKTRLSLGFFSKTSSALTPNHCASTSLSVRTGSLPEPPLGYICHHPSDTQHHSPWCKIHKVQREGSRQKLLSMSHFFSISLRKDMQY